MRLCPAERSAQNFEVLIKDILVHTYALHHLPPHSFHSLAELHPHSAEAHFLLLTEYFNTNVYVHVAEYVQMHVFTAKFLALFSTWTKGKGWCVHVPYPPNILDGHDTSVILLISIF